MIDWSFIYDSCCSTVTKYACILSLTIIKLPQNTAYVVTSYPKIFKKHEEIIQNISSIKYSKTYIFTHLYSLEWQRDKKAYQE